jgi:hypothetical protein
MPLFLKFDLRRECNEVRGGYVGTAEAQLLGEPMSQTELEPAEHEGCDEFFPQLL